MISSRAAALASVSSCFLILAGASMLAAGDDARAALSLGFLRPLVETGLPAGRWLVQQARPILEASGAALAILLVLSAFVTSGAGRRLVLACGFAVAGQVFLIVGSVPAGALLYALAALALIGESRTLRGTGASPAATSVREPFGLPDFVLLTVLTVVAVYLRFYALNQVFDYFEGELSPYSAGATDLRGMLYANVGHMGPWAPLGYLYYLPLYVTTKLFGVTLLSIRLASAVPSALTVVLLYGLVRRIAGREAAAVAAFFVALDPLQIGWGRSDIHPHGSTVQVAILLCWATVAAAESGRWRDFLLVAFLMGLSMHQYPSGQAAVLIPPAFFVWRWACGAPLLRGRAAVSSLGGLGLWAFGFPLQYLLAYGRWQVPNLLTIFGARTSWADAGGTDPLAVLGQVVERSWTNFCDLVEGIFVHVPYLFHQSFIPEYPGLPMRSVVWIAVPFAVVASVRGVLGRRGDGRALILLWALIGLLPSVLSAQGFPKRASITYPAILALGGIGIAAAVRVLADRFGSAARVLVASIASVAAGAYLLAVTHLWFAGDRFPYGTPREVDVAREVGRLLEPGTIVVGDFWEHYNEGKFLYLLLNGLQRPEVKPVAWYVLRDASTTFEALLKEVSSIIPELRRTIGYTWTPLRDHLEEVEAREAWSRIVWIAQIGGWDRRSEPIQQRLATLRGRCGHAAEEFSFDDKYPDRRFQVLVCALSFTADQKTGGSPQSRSERDSHASTMRKDP